MIYKLLPLFLLVFFSFKTTVSTSSKPKVTEVAAATLNIEPTINFESVYNNLKSNDFMYPSKESFTKALEGYHHMKEKRFLNKDILTIIDFSLSSSEKRLWVIDIKENSILFQSLVAHGRNSGNEFALLFSNKPESHKSSLGFYATGETYYGKHGYSMRLDGLEEGINNNARKRAIVIHGAAYVSESFIQQNGRLGRSFGCPSLPKEDTKKIIDLIKNESCLFIYYP